MSINGDVTVVRNGRSTSQVSVYNYPEHLNPFYEDENHKRLRFWKINKQKNGTEGRRSSFSINGLKEMWTFKSFRMKKKSSSLGINKTSESPPPLRRDVCCDQTNYNTYDPRMRYTTGGLTEANGNFQRNVPYRGSLQNMYSTKKLEPTSNGMGFNRNDIYRNTIQTAGASSSLTLPQPRRYVYRGSVTPQPLRNSDFNRNSNGMISRGSSQASVKSKNPFDDEEDDDEIDVVINRPNQTSGHANQVPRKKRRAPPPPPTVSVHQIITEESSSSTSTPSHNTSQQQKEGQNERLNISELTAEIESFVKTSNDNCGDETNKPNQSVVKLKTNEDTRNLPKQDDAISISMPTKEITDIYKTELIVQENEDDIADSHPPGQTYDIKENTLKEETSKEVKHVETIQEQVQRSRTTAESGDYSRVSTFHPNVKTNNVPEMSAKTVCLSSPSTFACTNATIIDTPNKKYLSEPSSIAIDRPRKQTSVESATFSEGDIEEEEILKIIEEPHENVLKPPIAVKPVVMQMHINCQERNSDTKETDEDESVENNVPVAAMRKHAGEKGKQSTPEIKLISADRKTPLTATRKSFLSDEKEANLLSNVDVKAAPGPKEIVIETKFLNLDKNGKTTDISPVSPPILYSAPLKIVESAENVSAVNCELNQTEEESATGFQIDNDNKEVLEDTECKLSFTKDITSSDDETNTIYHPKQPSTLTQWKTSTLAPLEMTVPLEKRKSVKDIIESINRSQRLLNASTMTHEDQNIKNTQVNGSKNQEDFESASPIPERQSPKSSNNFEQNLKTLDDSQREVKRIFHQLAYLENVHEAKLVNNSDENMQDIDAIEKKINNSSLSVVESAEVECFKKNTIKKEVHSSRESSPTSSNLDWNPLPKPKRTKNMSSPVLTSRNNLADDGTS